VRDDLSYKGATASFIASLSMALLAAVALANAGGSTPAIQLIFAAIVAVTATAMSGLLLRVSMELLHARRAAASRKLVPVPIRVRERTRARR
jgi:hypothetical protein